MFKVDGLSLLKPTASRGYWSCATTDTQTSRVAKASSHGDSLETVTHPDEPSTGGFMQLLPIELTIGMACTAIQAGMLPWGSPSAMALIGHSESDSAIAMVVIGYEWPTTWLRTTEPLSPFDLEWLHVQRFRSDHVLALRSHPFWKVREGADPPDVLADTPEGSLGLECTRFAIPARQQAHGLFRAIRQRIATVSPEHFAAVAGHVVYMWFNDDGSSLGLPFGRPEEEAARTLVQALAEYRPSPEQLWVAGNGLPEQAPQLPLIHTEHGAAFYCIPMTSSTPDSMLFSYAGFEIGLAFTTTHQADTEWSNLWARILKKDQPGNDWLLISAGAPDNRGVVYPSEESLAEFLLANPARPASLENLKRVTIHFWSSGKAVDLWPDQRVLFGPLYTGLSPAHRPLVPSPAS
jgi:hypothetical protein